jgi:hypothetical protein
MRGPSRNDDTPEGLFGLFDFLLDDDVEMGTISINDVQKGKWDKTVELLKALRAWEETVVRRFATLDRTDIQNKILVSELHPHHKWVS